MLYDPLLEQLCLQSCVLFALCFITQNVKLILKKTESNVGHILRAYIVEICQQVALRFLIQRNLAAVPKCNSVDHQKENFTVSLNRLKVNLN